MLAASGGDAGAQDRPWSAIYDELRKLAQQQMAVEAARHTRQPTALVHEAYFRLFGETPVQWASRGHSFTAAAAMRRIRVDDARRKGRSKRGGGQRPASMEPAVFDQDPVEVIAVGEALEELEQSAPRRSLATRDSVITEATRRLPTTPAAIGTIRSVKPRLVLNG